MNQQQTSRVALVTGASSGIGREIAKRLARDGITVYGAARHVEKMEELKGMGINPVTMDVTKDEEVGTVVGQIEGKHEGIDILVNDAGFGCYGSVEETPIDDAKYQFEVNLFGLARVTKGVLPGMRRRKSGRIVNISSMGGKIYTPLGAWYHASKHALEGWSDCLRMEVDKFGIHIIIIEPGIIESHFPDVMLKSMMERSGEGPYADMARSIEDSTKRLYAPGSGSPPEEVADTVMEAVNADDPRTRYSVGKYARPLMLSRKWLGDRLFDRIIMSQSVRGSVG